MNTIIEIKDFKKQYHNYLVSIKDITFTKRVNLLVGKNGSGKSTLLKGMAKLINHEGQILNDCKISFMSEFVSYPLDLDLNTFLTQLNKISMNLLSENEMTNLLVNFRILDKLNESLHSLSKGMKAKVNVIQCLMEDADIYLLDEPISGLDKLGVKSLIEYIKASKKMFVISTHLDNDFKEICDEVFYL